MSSLDVPLTPVRRRRFSPFGHGVAATEERAAYLFLTPWLAGLVLLLAIPLVFAVCISVTDEQLLQPGVFVGLDNYARTIDGRLFRQAIVVTLRWVVLTTPLF